MKKNRSLKELRRKAKLITKQTGVQHNVHHRRPISRSGTDDESNISIVPTKVHDAFHVIFQNHSPEGIAKILSERWIDPEWELIARKKFKIT